MQGHCKIQNAVYQAIEGAELHATFNAHVQFTLFLANLLQRFLRDEYHNYAVSSEVRVTDVTVVESAAGSLSPFQSEPACCWWSP